MFGCIRISSATHDVNAAWICVHDEHIANEPPFFKALRDARIVRSVCGYGCYANTFRPHGFKLDDVFRACGFGELYPHDQIAADIEKIPSHFHAFERVKPVFTVVGSDSTVYSIVPSPAEMIEIEKPFREQMGKLIIRTNIEKVLEAHNVKEKTDAYLNSVLDSTSGKYFGLFQGFDGFIREDLTGTAKEMTSWRTNFDYPEDPWVYIGIAYYYPNAHFGIHEPFHLHGN